MSSHFTRLQRSSRDESLPSDHPHSWDIPVKFYPSGGHDDEVTIPEPDNFKEVSVPLSLSSLADFRIPDTTKAALLYPLPGHLATHLCLLECFHKLKQEVMRSDHLDDVFQLPPEYDFKSQGPNTPTGTKGETKEEKESLANTPPSTNSTRRWELFVKLAADRFDIWWRNIDKIVRHATMYTNHAPGYKATDLAKDYLPPLDVLLVWYSYMLQPTYQDDCVRFGRDTGFALPLPWKAINEIIDHRTPTYNLPVAAGNLFKTISSQSADLLSYLTLPPPYAESVEPQYSVDLEEVVHMQEAFIEEAHRLLWLRSPALRGSLNRSLERYNRYLHLIYLYPTERDDLTPTWDIDLSWRTHRLYPENYLNFVTQRLNQPPPPPRTPEIGKQKEATDEKHDQPTPDLLSQLWGQHFKKEEPPSSSCFCWRCEISKDMLPQGSVDLFRKQQKEAQELLGFHFAVEKAREAGLHLPAPLPQMVKKQKKEEKWEVNRGAGYYEKIIPAKYDKHGNMVKPEERKVKREKGFTSGFNWTMYF